MVGAATSTVVLKPLTVSQRPSENSQTAIGMVASPDHAETCAMRPNMTQKAAMLVDAGAAEAGEASNMAKYAAAVAGQHAVDAAIQTHGGNGITIEYGISDLWWAVRTLHVAPVSAEMVLNHVAQHSLGLPRSY